MKRSLPFFNALLKAPSKNRVGILKSFPQFVVDDLVEILYNIITGVVKVRKDKLNKHKKALLDLKNAKSKIGRRRIIYNQKGGFLGALIPVITSIAGGIASQFT